MSDEVREYRGQRVDNGKWVYGYYFITSLTIENFGAGHLGDGITRHCISTDVGVVFAVLPDTVGQFTGEYSQDDYKIFEGDRLFEEHLEEWYIVGFEEGKYVAFDETICFDLCEVARDCIINGNIHEAVEELME